MKEMSHLRRLTPTQWIVIATVVILLPVLTMLLADHLPLGVDWAWSLRPAALKLLHGNSPYLAATAEEAFAGAPWALLPLIPLALLPVNVGRALLLFISLAAFTVAALRLGAGPLALGAFLVSPPVVHCLLNANLDWLPVLGFTLSPWLGLFFIAVKPQMGSVVAIFWLVEAWRTGGPIRVVKVFAPVGLALLLSFGLFGWWPLAGVRILEYSRLWNASLWPVSIPVGLALAVTALRRRDKRLAMGASPCLSPYVLFHAWSGALASIVSSTPETVAAVIGLWILVAMVGLS
jgi:hypothetical protein